MAISLDARIHRMHTPGLIDMHFDLPLDLYDRRGQQGLLRDEFAPELRVGGVSLVGAALLLKTKICLKWGCAWRSTRLPASTKK
ncbi:MAG: hypothetical protein IPM07_23595 [Anaerolineales bacterium]|nr:hypothetical protein [Anaerolineales bacterium]